MADVGHDLLMRSQQNNNDYDSRQTSVAAGGSFTFGTMSGSGYINASQDKMKSRFDSVAEQTGLYAGDGGFDITVGHHTQLDGAVIASTATPDKNSLDTGTLGFSDIHNEADFKTSHSGISLSGGGSFGDKFKGNLPGGMISAAGNSGHAEGTTQAAVANGTLTLRDKVNQKQDVADLSRDTEHANDSISPIFDKEKEQNRLKAVGMISDIGSQVADIARTQGDLNGLKAAQKASGTTLPANATEKEHQNYLAELRDTQAYKEVMVTYGTGSNMQRGIQAATAALQGLAGGNIGGALAGASAPELANIIGHHAGIDDNTAAKAIAHAILGGVTAALQGNSAAAGAVGAASGELVATAIARQLYPDTDPSKLTEDQKQTVSTLATVSAGMAGGIAGGNTAGAAAGASAGKNAVENNWADTPSTDEQVRKLSGQWQKALDGCAGGDSAACAEKDKLEKSYGFLAATAMTGMMGGTASAAAKATSAGVSMLINGTAQGVKIYNNPEDSFNYTDFMMSGATGWFSAGTGAVRSSVISVSTAYTGSVLQNEDPTAAVAGALAGSAIGYTAGKLISAPLKPLFNNVRDKYEEVPIGGYSWMTGAKPESPIPGTIGGLGGSVGAEVGGDYVNDKYKAHENGK